jgi:hypothetical protein
VSRAVLLLVVLASSASAQRPDPPKLEVLASPCTAASWAGEVFADLARVELSQGVVAHTAANARLWADVPNCSEQVDIAYLVLEHLGTGQRCTRSVELASVAASARVRTLALAAAELVRSCWEQVSAKALPAQTQLALEVTVKAAAPAPQPEAQGASTHLSLVAESRLHGALGVGLFGARAGAIFRPSAFWTVTADAGFGLGRIDTTLGAVNATQATGAVAAMIGRRTSAALLAVGPKLEGGVQWLSGEPADPTVTAAGSGDTFSLYVALSALVEVALGSSLSAVLGLDAGVGVRGLKAKVNDVVLFSLTGPYLGLRLGVGWAL